jgi:hypothetical protein
MSKSIRISVGGRNLQFLRELSEQMDEPDLGAVMAYLLADVRCLNYAIGNKPPHQPQQQTAPLGYSFNISTFEPAIAPSQDNQNTVEIDPVIARMASLIEEF